MKADRERQVAVTVPQGLDRHRPVAREPLVGPAGQRRDVDEVALLEAHTVDPRRGSGPA